MSKSQETMKVEIWSDIMCPFCYIGKRKFESAMRMYEHADQVSIDWHSFQLDPGIEKGHGKNLYQYLSERKGISERQSVEMHRQVTELANEVGLVYDFDKAIVANSFDAHRLIQVARTLKLGDLAEERLFRAYFTEGKDLSDHEVLVKLGEDIGISRHQVLSALNDTVYEQLVKDDIAEAAQLGIRAVPFFVFNRKYAVSGAQPYDVFLQALQQSFSDWQKDKTPLSVVAANAGTCTPEGECD